MIFEYMLAVPYDVKFWSRKYQQILTVTTSTECMVLVNISPEYIFFSLRWIIKRYVLNFFFVKFIRQSMVSLKSIREAPTITWFNRALWCVVSPIPSACQPKCHCQHERSEGWQCTFANERRNQNKIRNLFITIDNGKKSMKLFLVGILAKK